MMVQAGVGAGAAWKLVSLKMNPGMMPRFLEEQNNMAKRSIAERLAQLEAQRQTLKAKLGKEERAKDTRRKVLLGALVLYRLSEDKREFDKILREWLQRELPGFLTREDDKTLFADLLAAPTTTSPQPETRDNTPRDLLTAVATGDAQT